jgi:hypothetical protein
MKLLKCRRNTRKMLQVLVLRYAPSETGDFAPWLVAWTLSFLGFENDCCPCFLWNKTTFVNNINIETGNVSIISFLTLEQFNLQAGFPSFIMTDKGQASSTPLKHSSRDVMSNCCKGHLRFACRSHSLRLFDDMPATF